jgi:hypothetical protein
MLLPSSKNIDYLFLRDVLVYEKSDMVFCKTSDLIECAIADFKEEGDKGSSLPFLGEFYV